MTKRMICHKNDNIKVIAEKPREKWRVYSKASKKRISLCKNIKNADGVVPKKPTPGDVGKKLKWHGKNRQRAPSPQKEAWAPGRLGAWAPDGLDAPIEYSSPIEMAPI